MNPRKTPGAEAPFDEAALRALFEEVDAPPSLARWRERIELATSTDVDRTTSSAGPVELRPARRVSPWVRAAAAGFAALAVGAGIVGVVAANRHPSPGPPDPTIIETTTGLPSTTASGPSTTAPTGSATGVSAPPGAPPASGSGPTNGQQPNPQIPPPYPAGTPVPVPLTGWPGADNTGVPPGTNLRVHSGDLRITTPGAVVSDLRVDGAVYVDAPDVTLVRMLVVPPAGNHAGVYQRPQAPRLTIEHTEIGGGAGIVRFGIEQEAAGLTVRRTDIHHAESAIGVSGDATIVDSFLHCRRGAEVYTVGNIARVTLRHNTIDGGLDIRDRIGPVTDITIDDNLLAGGVDAPTGSGSRDVRVTNNQFRGFPGDVDPSNGWNGQAPGFVWTGNVWSRNGEPANP